MLVNTLNSLGTLGAFGNLGKHGPKDQYYQKAKEFTLCLDEITKNYDKQIAAVAASTTVGKQLAQSFATYRKVAAFHQPIFPIVEFLQKSTTWLTSAEELHSKFFTTMNDKTFTNTKNNVRSQTSNLKAIKAKNIQNDKLAGVHSTLRREEIAPKKTSEQLAFEIEEMTMTSLYSFWEAYLEYFEEGQKLMHKVKDGVLFMKKLSLEAAKAKRLGVKKVFGVPLEELAEREAPAYLPQVLENMLASISKLVSLEGIFRVSGSKTAIDSLRETIDTGNIPDFAAVQDPHTVPSLFKTFLRMLPVPLIPYENFEMVPNLNIPGLPAQVVINHLKALVHSLPPAHYHLLGRLLSLCSKIVAEKATTKMNASNIAVVIGPNIIRLPENPSSPESFGDSNTLVQLLVEHFEGIYPEKISTVHEDPLQSSARKQRAHGVTIDRATVKNLNWEAQIALSNQDPAERAPLSRSASQNSVEAQHATKDPQSSFRQSARPSVRVTRSVTTTPPLPNGFTYARGAHKSGTPGSFLGSTRSNTASEPAPNAPAPASPTSATSPAPAPAPASSTPTSPTAAASSAPTSPPAGSPTHSPKYPIIGYHPKVLPTPPSSSPSPSPPSPRKAPPSPPSLAPRPHSPTSPAAPAPPVSLTPTPSASSASSLSVGPKKIIGGAKPAPEKSSSPFSASTPNLPSFNLDPSMYAPQAHVTPAQAQTKQSPAQTTQPPAEPSQPTPPAQSQQPAPVAQPTPTQPTQPQQFAQATTASAQTQQPPRASFGHARTTSTPPLAQSFRTAKPTARDAAPSDNSTDAVKAEIQRTISNVVSAQIRVICAKFAEVNSIVDGVPFIHVLKAITPELEKLKKVMPTPPTFEKLPELPPDQSKFTRLKFTIDFALKDCTRALEHVASYVSEDNSAELQLLQNILQVISELQRILAFNINKL